jgi:hypothetical protein
MENNLNQNMLLNKEAFNVVCTTLSSYHLGFPYLRNLIVRFPARIFLHQSGSFVLSNGLRRGIRQSAT